MRQKLQDRAEATALLSALTGMTIVALEARMSETWGPWTELAVVAALGAVCLVLALGLGRGTQAASAVSVTVAAVAVPTTFLLLLSALGADDPTGSGGGLTFALLLTLAVLGLLWRQTGSVACALLAPLVAVGLLLEAVNWIGGTEEVDVFRALLALTSLGLIASAFVLSGRVAQLVAVAGGLAMLALAFITGGYPFVFIFFFGAEGGPAWGWGAVQLVGGLALLVFALRHAAPGPGYLGGVLLLQVALYSFAFPDDFDGEPTTDAPSIVGWPLAIVVLTALAAAYVLRPGGAQPAAVRED